MEMEFAWTENVYAVLATQDNLVLKWLQQDSQAQLP